MLGILLQALRKRFANCGRFVECVFYLVKQVRNTSEEPFYNGYDAPDLLAVAFLRSI